MTWTSTHLYLFACVYIDYKITLPNDTLVDSSLTKIKVRTGFSNIWFRSTYNTPLMHK